MKNIKHKRVNQALTAEVEQKLINRILPLIPSWINSDILTFIGFLGSLIVAAGYFLSSQNKSFLFLSVFGFIVNWFGDSLDGGLARFRQKTRPRYGYFIDHMMDAFSIVIIGLGFANSPFLNKENAMGLVIIYLLFEIYVLLVESVQKIFKFSFGFVGPTEMRLLGICLSLYLYFSSSPQVNTFFSISLGLITLGFLYIVAKKAIKLNEMDVHN